LAARALGEDAVRIVPQRDNVTGLHDCDIPPGAVAANTAGKTNTGTCALGGIALGVLTKERGTDIQRIADPGETAAAAHALRHDAMGK
jgi:hypothetical protein